MNISEILKNTLGQNTINESSKSVKANPIQDNEESSNLQEDNKVFAEDTVSLSPTSRQLAQISKIIADDNVARAEKVATLKRQISNGEYNISSYEVGKALLDYIEADL
ncbi:MAG: flagellar biosynthesis anti-sigma factor FlgM [Deltaproteobacteria bacterium]|jgi:flagellar biosynthesis anti-sigma factor FlgM|nr:flagellar biosynthesis anti-sigma factor FlgM [Deltaproteobacteria bacterium]